ncbi:hypothetical protein [Yonghaparkia sp. Root332]|uniref:hypothetical protein n=1 Tax=Yonghaparkia sp. Root332 TaxID=1736516 RepID=UPI0012E3B818|nr:hypothetical protein [Yonghaparkia sp. Root332]
MTDKGYGIPALRDVYLEGSWVLGFTIRPDSFTMRVEFVLLPTHPAYRKPQHGEMYSYRRGDLSFEHFATFEWKPAGFRPATDAKGEVDYGSIDLLQADHEVVQIEGDFGVIRVMGGSVAMNLLGP